MKSTSARFLLVGALTFATGVWWPLRAGDVARVVPDFAALARHATTVLPSPPPWLARSRGAIWTIEQITAAIAQVTSRPPQINYVRSNFVCPDHRWLLAYVDWFGYLQKPLGIRFRDVQFDCDKFSRCFAALADLLAIQAGESRGTIAVGWAIVFNDKAFAGIAAGGAHSVVIVGTSQGLYVVEPQNGTIVALRDYPNRDSILAVYL